MNRNSTIDDIFKDGLNNTNFSNREALWKKMEEELDNKKRKKRFALILLLCCLITGGFFATKNVSSNKKIFARNKLVQVKKNKENFKADKNAVAGTSKTQPAANPVLAAIPVVSKQSLINRKSRMEPGRAVIITTASGVEENAEDAFIAERMIADLNTLSYTSSYKPAVIAQSIQPKGLIKPLVKNNETQLKKFSLEAVAGSDIFNLDKKVGYYAGIRVNRHLDKGTLISVGINYSFNTVNENYRLSNKPLQQQETDAQINNLKMLRFPVMFERHIPKTKFALMAGLIPAYILDAAIYNVPNSNTGNPAQYRVFTLNDINRFNILFGAGIKYSPFKKVAFELSGCYGFTELVKDSYINQSNVNDNFKNIQAGVVFLLK